MKARLGLLLAAAALVLSGCGTQVYDDPSVIYVHHQRVVVHHYVHVHHHVVVHHSTPRRPR